MAEDKIEKASQFGDEPSGKQRLWLTEIQAAEKDIEKFLKDAKRINRRYLDKRDANEEGESRVNIFWSTIQVVLATVYSRPPKADVSRLYKDPDDDVGRVASEMLQRILNNEIEQDGSDFDASARHAIQDYLIVGEGQLWNRYEANTQSETVPATFDEMGNEIEPEQQFERLLHEDAITEWVSYDDFLYSPARVWEEVRWVARRVYMTRDALVARFGEEIGNAVPLVSQKTTKKGYSNEVKNDPWQKGEVWEIWCKESKHVYWLSKGMDKLLDERPDPLGLENFFPCGQPLMANLTTANLIARADFIMAQDQFDELDEINTRIKYLTRAAKIVGVYDKAAGDSVGRMFQQAAENQLIPVDNWAMFAESGGVKGKIDWVPLDQITNAIDHLRVYRSDKVQQIYEVLGISDIMRGASKASETAAAQQIKASFGSTRLQLKQFFVAQFIQTALQIKAEIIMKHFTPETILMRSNVQFSPDKALAPQAVQLLKEPVASRYRVVVQSDSMAAIDWAAERESRMEFLNGLGAFLNAAMPMAQAMPGSAPFLLRMIQWGMSAFKGSQQIEGILDQAISSLEQKSKEPPAPPSPEQMADVEEKRSASMEKRAGAVKDLADAMEKMAMIGMPLPIPLETIVDGGLMGAGGETVQNLMGKLEQLAVGVASPKRVVRDQIGKVIGVEPVQGQTPPQAPPMQPAAPIQQPSPVGQLSQRIDQLAAMMSAPKKVVRDQTGKVVGVAPALPQMPAQGMPAQAPMPQPQNPIGVPNA